jgi:hypothetical protein
VRRRGEDGGEKGLIRNCGLAKLSILQPLCYRKIEWAIQPQNLKQFCTPNVGVQERVSASGSVILQVQERYTILRANFFFLGDISLCTR